MGGKITSIVVLLKETKPVDLPRLQQAASDAFRGAPEPPQVIALPNGTHFGLKLGPLSLGIIQANTPYFKDAAKVADQLSDFAARRAVQEHQAWLSVDLVGESPISDPEAIYNWIGCLVAELLDDNAVGLIRLPGGPVIGYDLSLIPLLRHRKAQEAFLRQAPARITKAKADDAALAAAAAEARERLPEFMKAFANARKGQGFGVKKRFEVEGKIEHMWVTVTKIDGPIFHGWLSNDPQVIRSMKLRDPVSLNSDEVEDWIYTNGRENVGGFQAKVLTSR